MLSNYIILAGLMLLVSFAASVFLTKAWIRAARRAGLVGKDMNKFEKRDVPESGGLAVIFSTVFGTLIYIFVKTFIMHTSERFILLLAIITTLLLAGFLGFIDDILGWKKGLPQWLKPILTIPIAIPIAVLNAGHSVMSIPFFGAIDFGILYPILITPIAIMSAANGFNLLAGMNGLEAGMGTIILSTLGLILFKSAPWLSLVSFIAVAALLGFLLFNWYPARVFPGNGLTYAIGALIAAIAILGNAEKLAVFLFVPYFIELALKARYKFKIESFGMPQRDGTLKVPEKSGSLTHVYAKIFKTERATVFALLATELCLATIAFFIV
jgi:UDP-N-acetylglucosamine--dolichyl-phosphate N-acetylglucosaminephosphotransferase